MKITLKRSGGFAGLPSQQQTIVIDAEELSAAEAKELKRLVKDARFFDQPPASTKANRARDAYQYEVTVDDDQHHHTASVSDGAMPDDLEPLIRWLTGKLAAHLKKKKAERGGGND
ncbi:MAG: hypothetical protein H0W76_05075 [Pyrinomonadaceae bacterium]|nr:hypothetical protein [Pyrinomonadaceae bacterium]